ncbi:hypothetical protein ACW2Q0_13390 [Nocardia sp. R16R-3T]
MSSAKTSVVLGPVRHATTLRLTRIATLVVGSLVFLYACEVSRKSDLSDVWALVAVAAGFALTGLTTAWFEVKAADHAATRARTDIRGFLIESDGITVRARITRSGDLVFHGHDTSGVHPAYEWDWAFRATTFPAIRTALGGGRGDLLALLEDTVPDPDRQDLGAWLHNQGIPAAFRERGDASHRITRELPVVEPEAPRRNPPRPSRSSHREPPDQDRPTSRRGRQDRRNPAVRDDEPPTRRRDRSSNSRRRASEHWEAQSQTRAGSMSSRRVDPPNDRWEPPPAQHREQPPDEPCTPTRARRAAPADPRRSPRSGDIPVEQSDYRTRWSRDENSGAHRHVLSGAHPDFSPQPNRREQQAQWRNERSGRRHRRS